MHRMSSRLLQIVAIMLVMLSLMGSSHEGSEAYQTGRLMGYVFVIVVVLVILVKIFGRKK